MSEHPTGTVTFLFTDIEGSTTLWQTHPDQMQVNLARHDELLRLAIERNEGYVFKTVGDAFCAAFPTALQGIKAAVESQQALAQENWGECVIKVRMGLHTGDAEERANDYFGNTVNRVARLMSAGHGGQILLSQAVQGLAGSGLPASTSLRDLGKHRLKNLIQPEHIFQLDIAGLPSEFAPLKTLDIQLSNLPSQLTHFVGRQREIKAVTGLLHNPTVRLVTLTGAGGTGKTRLSLQIAADLLNEYEHGVWFIELATITNPELFLPTVAAALKVKEAANTTIADALYEHLAGKQALLVLDNFEQIASGAQHISELLRAAAGVKVLVSSREVLHLRGEHDYPVPPLGLPERQRHQTAATLAQCEAIALFVQHAQAVNPAFELTEENAATVAAICIRLDGLPLAIELAAARSKILSTEVMLEKLKKNQDVLVSRARDLPKRQQTIRGAIDWSYELLDEAEKKLFSRLGVFVGGWTVEAAEAVCGAGLDGEMFARLESLFDKSLIRQFEGVSGETRFTMLETIREYAHEKLSQSGELPAIQQAHAEAMAQFLEIVIDAQSGPEEADWFAKLDDDLDNLRTVIAWAFAQHKPSYIFLMGRIYQYWNQRSIMREPLEWLERALAMNEGTALERARAMNCAGSLLYMSENSKQARRYWEAALALFREMGNTNEITNGLHSLALIACDEKNYEKARQMFEEVLAIGREPNSWSHSTVLINLGSLAMIRGDYVAALDYFTHSREICVNLGAETGVSYADWFLGTLALAQRNLAEAQVHFQNQLKASWLKANPLMFRVNYGYHGYIQLLLGNKQMAQRLLNDAIDANLEYLEQNPHIESGWLFLDGKARLELMDGYFERAARLFGAAWTQREKDSWLLTEFERPDYEARIAEIRAALGVDAFNTAFEKGRAMGIKDALVFAAES